MTSKTRTQLTKPSTVVASVLERDLNLTIEKWTERVNKTKALTDVKLNHEERMGHLPRLLEDIVARLRLAKNTTPPNSSAARDHGTVRFKQCYTVSMLIEESRLLQISIFETLHRNQNSLDPEVVLLDVMTIADECDSQLGHTIDTFMEAKEKKKIHVAA
jgi:hypothetical protein